MHNIRRRTPPADQPAHGVHVGVDVVEESLVTLTQVVQPIFAVRGMPEAVLGAAAIAGKANLADLAVARQRAAFFQPKGSLLV